MKLLPQFTQRRPDDNIDHLLNKIHHADALELLARLPDESIDMVLCDLPYGVTQAFYDSIIPLKELWEGIMRVIKPRNAIVLTATQPFSSLLVSSNPDRFRYEWIWNKHRKTNFLNAKKMPLTGHEQILIFGKSLPAYYPQMTKSNGHKSGAKHHKGTLLYGRFDGAYYEHRNEYYPDTVLKIPHDGNLSVTYKQHPGKIPTHPNQKPITLFEYLIKTYTKPGEIVLDMTCGSGTTAMAARKTNRQFICGDNHLPYVELARKRLQNTDPFQATVNEDGSKQLSLFDTA